MQEGKSLRVCIIHNGAPHYRRGIYKLLDNNFDCSWFVDKGDSSIKQLPLSFFKSAQYLNIKKLKGGFYCQPGKIRLLLDKHYDVYLILGEYADISTWLGVFLHNLFNRKRKVYFWSHGILRDYGGIRSRLNTLFFRLPYGTFTYGERARKVMIRKGLNGDKIWAVHNSLDYDEQVKLRGNFTNIYKDHFNNSNPVLYFIGRLTPIKKLDMIISAVKNLKEGGLMVNLVFIGEGPVKTDLEKQVKELGLEENVWFYGACYDEKEKSELIANADLCVAPGNIGLTAMDSLMYGTPAITMDNFDMQMPEHEAIKDGLTGTFFKENDVDDLTTKIYTWLCQFRNREEQRENCYKKIDSFWNPTYSFNVFKAHLDR